MTGMVSLAFTVPAMAAKPEAKAAFYQAKTAYYEHLLGRDIPGGAWFRHQARLTRAEQNLPPAGEVIRPPRWPGRTGELTETYDLFTGGRAMSENLQLDRALPPAQPNELPVKIDSLTGITINEIDWKPLLKDARPKLDPLAAKLSRPISTSSSFPVFRQRWPWPTRPIKHDTPVLRLAEPRRRMSRSSSVTRAQLGLSLSSLARLLGPQFVNSVAADRLRSVLPDGDRRGGALRVAAAGGIGGPAPRHESPWRPPEAQGDAKPVGGEVGGVKYRGFVSPDRSMSSYVARLDGAVVVTNSLYQLERLAAAARARRSRSPRLPEYAFFRIRYPLGDAQETALAFLSDATIRRWCGPRWRLPTRVARAPGPSWPSCKPRSSTPW